MNKLTDVQLWAIYNERQTLVQDALRNIQDAVLAINPPTESDFILIDTEEKRKAYAPKLATDEFWSDTNCRWDLVNYGDTTFSDETLYRRKVTTGAAWRPVSEGVTFPCIVGNCNTGKTNYAAKEIFHPKEWTHFFPVPKMPAPEFSKVERLFIKLYEGTRFADRDASLGLFKAGFEAAKGDRNMPAYDEATLKSLLPKE